MDGACTASGRVDLSTAAEACRAAKIPARLLGVICCGVLGGASVAASIA